MIYVPTSPTPPGTTVILTAIYIYRTRRNIILPFISHESRNLRIRSRKHASLPFFEGVLSNFTVLLFHRNNSVISVQKDRDTSRRGRRNWNTIIIGPTIIASLIKSLVIMVHRVRNAKGKLPVMPAILSMYLRQGKVSSFKLQSLSSFELQ